MKAAKIAIIVLAPIVLVVGLIWSFSGGTRGGLPQEVWVDVTTGEIVPAPKGVTTIPAPNAAGQRVVFPLAKENGELVVPGAYRSVIQKMAETNPDIKVDLNTFVIRK